MEKIHLVYYSPALSTRKTIRLIARGMKEPAKEYDITQNLAEPLSFDAEDLVIFAVPAYAGRVPVLAAETFRDIKGDNTPAIVVCVYGNRDYDDALLELRDLCITNGFVPIAGGAFVARHSIFPKVGMNRPDDEDIQRLTEFGELCLRIYKNYKHSDDIRELKVNGNYPYREPSKIPFVPKASSKCDNCGICVKRCPVEAISEQSPKKTDKNLCISCARCITVCPQQARSFGGILYKLVKRKFESSYKERREPEIFFSE